MSINVTSLPWRSLNVSSVGFLVISRIVKAIRSGFTKESIAPKEELNKTVTKRPDLSWTTLAGLRPAVWDFRHKWVHKQLEFSSHQFRNRRRLNQTCSSWGGPISILFGQTTKRRNKRDNTFSYVARHAKWLWTNPWDREGCRLIAADHGQDILIHNRDELWLTLSSTAQDNWTTVKR